MNPFGIILEKANGKANIDAKARFEKDRTFFWKAYEDFGELSQWYISDFVYEGITFRCMEQFMMYKKAMLFGDVDTASMIMRESNAHPNVYRQLGRRVANFHEWVWRNECRDIVVDGNLHKFMQNSALRTKLLSTENTLLVEASPYDRKWGIGYGADIAMVNVDRWGDNLLGTCLMTVRDMIRDFMKLSPDPMTGIAKVSVDTIVLCHPCLAMTRITPNNIHTREKVDDILITICGMCRNEHESMNPVLNTYGLATVVSMVQGKRGDIVSWSEIENGTMEKKLIHPDLIVFINKDDCTIMRSKGFEHAEVEEEMNTLTHVSCTSAATWTCFAT